MATSYLERLATRETGRLGAETAGREIGRLVVYPSYIEYEHLIRVSTGKNIRNFYLEYEPSVRMSAAAIRDGIHLLLKLIRLLPHCEEVVLFRCSDRYDYPGVLLTAATARLIGIPVVLCDYSFPASTPRENASRLYSLCRRIELGDTSGFERDRGASAPVSYRIDSEDLSTYRVCAKDRSVPSVLVYGDFDDSRTRSLVTRIYGMVKQKYPRTEFRLVAPAPVGYYDSPDDRRNGSFLFCYPRTARDMQELFTATDTVLLVSPGGINRDFISRARAAGFPVIVNGLEYPDEEVSGQVFLTVPRDSYSGLAEAIISLVDDETRYRSFGSV